METFELRERGAWRLAWDALVLYLKKLPVLGLALALLALPAASVALVVPDPVATDDAFFLTAVLYMLAAGLTLIALVVRVCSYHITGVRAALRQHLRQLHPKIVIPAVGASMAASVLLTLTLVPGSLMAAAVSGEVADVSAQYTVLALLTFLLPLTWLTVRLVFVFPAAVLEGRGPRKAIRRSFDLTRGEWWRLLGALVAYVVLVGTAVIGTGVLAAAVAPHLDLTPEVTGPVAMALAVIVLAPLALVYSVLLYYDARVRKEFLHVRDLI